MTNLIPKSSSLPTTIYTVGAGVVHPELLKPFPASTESSGLIVVYDKATSEKMDSLQEDLRVLSQRMTAIEKEKAELPVIELRDLTNAKAKDEIRGYFELHDGETIYPSDVAEALMIDYDQVKMLLMQLEADGAVEKKA